MVNELMVELSRWQFAATSLYHFIFVPLTLGISWLVFIMELVYVATGKVIYRDMAKFWGKLFAINFAIGVATGITLEFEFGTNWSNYSHYVGDIFGAPLALEGLMAFFLESTFIGLMFTGWARFGKKTHLLITFLTALGSNLSAMWILIANGWMQYPEFAEFFPERMRMEMVDFWGLVFSDVAQVKFLHTVTAGYTTAAFFVIGVSAFLMLKRKSLTFAKRSMTIAIVFALCAMGGSGLSGDLSALAVTEHQPAKLAAMEAEYETQEPPASWSILALPNEEAMDNYFSIRIPALLGIIATHSLDTPVQGMRDIVANNEQRVRRGLIANRALTEMRAGNVTPELQKTFNLYKKDLGYGLLLVEHAQDPLNPTEAEIKVAARHSVPPVFITYYAFRVMMGIVGLLGLLALAAGFFLWYKRDLHTRTLILKGLVLAIPLPFIACEAGWLIAEIGRQPWAIQDILPTFLATSTLSPTDVGISLLAFVGIYTVLLFIEMKLMVHAIKLGPTLTEAEPDGKGYPPLPPCPPSGSTSNLPKFSATPDTVAVAAVAEATEASETTASAAPEDKAKAAKLEPELDTMAAVETESKDAAAAAVEPAAEVKSEVEPEAIVQSPELETASGAESVAAVESTAQTESEPEVVAAVTDLETAETVEKAKAAANAADDVVAVANGNGADDIAQSHKVTVQSRSPARGKADDSESEKPAPKKRTRTVRSSSSAQAKANVSGEAETSAEAPKAKGNRQRSRSKTNVKQETKVEAKSKIKSETKDN